MGNLDILKQPQIINPNCPHTKYSEGNKYLIPCRFCKFAHCQRNEQSIILMVGLF